MPFYVGHLPFLKKHCASREFCPHPFKCCCLSFSKSLSKSHCLAAGEGNLIIHGCSGSIAAGSPLHWQGQDCLSLCSRQLLARTLYPSEASGKLLLSSVTAGSGFQCFEEQFVKATKWLFYFFPSPPVLFFSRQPSAALAWSRG